jgi:hypothetical protein
MSIVPYFYFSNNILFDFPSSGWFNFFVVDLVLTLEVLKGVRTMLNYERSVSRTLFMDENSDRDH